MSPFASITADILARKGEARPWNSFGADLAKAPLAWEPPPHIHQAMAEPPPKIQQALAAPVMAPPDPQPALTEAVAPPRIRKALPPPALPPKIMHPEVKLAAPDAAGADLRKYTVKISNHDYERLGILAVKQGKSRQRLLQETVNNLFLGLSTDYGASCQCLGKSG